MPAGSRNPIGETIQEALNAIAEYLDELSIDPKCDDLTSRSAADAVRHLVPALTRKHGYGLGHAAAVLTRHESLSGELTAEGDAKYGQDVDGTPMPLAKLLTCACVQTTGQAMALSANGINADAACYVGISMALKAVTLAITGRDDAGLNALWAWSGVSDTDEPIPDWQKPLNRAEVPLDLLGMDESDEGM